MSKKLFGYSFAYLDKATIKPSQGCFFLADMDNYISQTDVLKR